MIADSSSAPSVHNAWQLVAGTYFSYGLFACFAVSCYQEGWSWSLPALFIMVLVPLLDRLSGEDLSARSPVPEYSVVGRLLRWAPHGFVAGYTVCIAIAVSLVQKMTLLELALAVYSVGMIGSIGIVAAHELVHKTTSWEKAFGRFGLADVLYMHFEIAHIRGHHVQAGTPADESTAWKGEPLYQFVFRTIPRCVQLAWRLEARRLQKKSASPWSIENLMLNFWCFQLLYIAVIGLLGGWIGIVFFVLQSAIAVFMLETVSYIEHYGLLRSKVDHDRYGNMTPAHSWDSYHRFSNYLEFHLQRHADHHSTPTKSYAELQPETAVAPRLPAGYPVMVTLAMIPPLWRSIMDQRIPRIQGLSVALEEESRCAALSLRLNLKIPGDTSQ